MIDDQIRQYISDNPGCTFQNIEEGTGWFLKYQIARSIIRLVNGGLVKTERGKYYYPIRETTK